MSQDQEFMVQPQNKDFQVQPQNKDFIIRMGTTMLGTKFHTAGNKTRYRVRYGDWLDDGVNLVTGTVVLTPSFAATITDVTITSVTVTPSHDIVFFLQGGSANETFTLDVQATDSRGEIKNDTLGFTGVAP